MEITLEMKQSLANFIVEGIKKEFQFVHLSKSLINSITIRQSGGSIIIDVDPKNYYIATYRKKGIIKYTKTGLRGDSYASKIDKTGGLSGKHKDYVNRCIEYGIQKWITFYKINAKWG